MELSTDNSEDPTAAGEQKPPTKHEKKTAFCKLLSQKLEEAQTSTDFLYTEESGDHQLLLKQGFLRTVPPRFDAYNRSQARHFRRSQDIPKHHQQQLEEVWEEHPDASLATAIRTVLGVPDLEKHDVPEDAANAVLDLLRRAGDATEGPNRSRYIWEVPSKRPLAEAWLGVWTDFWRLRGPDFFRELCKQAAHKDIGIFSVAGESLVEELTSLKKEREIEIVGRIARIVLNALTDEAKCSPPAVQVAVRPVIEGLKRALSIPDTSVEHLIASESTNLREPEGKVAAEPLAWESSQELPKDDIILEELKIWLAGRKRVGQKYMPVIRNFLSDRYPNAPRDPEEEERLIHRLRRTHGLNRETFEKMVVDARATSSRRLRF